MDILPEHVFQIVSGADESWLAHWDLMLMASNDYAHAQEGERRYRCGLIRRDVARDMLSKDVIFRAGGNSVSRQKWAVDGDRKVKKEAMFQYGKIHARGVVMSRIFASSLTWDGDCKTKLRDFLHRSLHAFNPRVKMSTC